MYPCIYNLSKTFFTIYIKTGRWSVRFSPGHSTTDEIFTLKQIFEKSWEFGKDLFACLTILKKCMTDFLGINFEWFCGSMAIIFRLLRAIKSVSCRPEVRVQVNGKQSKPFYMGVGLWQARVRFVTFPFHCSHELDRQMQPS